MSREKDSENTFASSPPAGAAAAPLARPPGIAAAPLGEARLVPAREETNLLASELMRLVNDVDRLAARIARLQQRRSRP